MQVVLLWKGTDQEVLHAAYSETGSVKLSVPTTMVVRRAAMLEMILPSRID